MITFKVNNGPLLTILDVKYHRNTRIECVDRDFTFSEDETRRHFSYSYLSGAFREPSVLRWAIVGGNVDLMVLLVR